MYQDALLLGKPIVDTRHILSTTGLMQQPGGSTATSKTMTNGVAGTEILISGEPGHLMKHLYQIGWQ